MMLDASNAKGLGRKRKRKRASAAEPSHDAAKRKRRRFKGRTIGGVLGRVPAEILQEILLDLDLRSLSTMCRLNSFYHSLVDDLPAYKLLREHASATLKIMHVTKTSSDFPVRRLFSEFCRPRCRTCEDFGPYIFLLTCRRCRFKCLHEHDDYRLAPVFDVMVNYALSKDLVKRLDSIYSLRGYYGFYREYQGRLRLVSASEAFELGINVHGSKRRMEKARDGLWMEAEDEYDEWRTLPINPQAV